MSRNYRLAIGPSMPVVPIRDFSRLPAEMLTGAWSIVGPSAEQNMRRDHAGRCCELWEVTAAAYLEGLQHGAALQKQD